MPFIKLGNQDLFFAQHIPRNAKQVLILVHGAGGSHLDWPAEVRRLPETAVFALDLPGHGRSSKPGRTSVSGYAQIVHEFIETLYLENVVVAGHSMGGAIAQTIGLRQLPQVAGLILVGTGARLRVTDAILGSILRDFDAAVQTITQLAWAPDAPPELVAKGKEMLAHNDPNVLFGDYNACNQFDVMNQLGKINVPVLVISGTADQLTPMKYGRYLADNIPHAQLVTIDGGGHMMALEQPQAVAQAITKFLNTLKTSKH